jgi:peptidyl-prolyl cis-trans isomerase D
MLDQMRKHSRSFIIYILFGIIIAVFVVNFGPQSAGCTAGTSYAGRVEGRTISGRLFAYALSVSGIRSQQVPEPQMIRLRSMVMDQLLMRELFADDALKLGVRIPEKDIDNMLLKGRFLALGQPRPLIRNDDGEFDYDLFSRYVRYSWQLTVRKFKADQRRELLAEKYRQFLKSSVKVSEDEVRKDFAQKNTQVQLSYVRFTPGEFSSMVKINPAKVSSFLAANKKRVKDYYEENKNAYQKLPKQVRLQVIRIDAKEGAKGAAKQRALAALKRLKGGEDFAKVAEETSDDKASRNSGGMLTWRNEDSPGVGDVADKAVTKLKKDELSDLLENKDSFSIIKVRGRRQGDLTLAQAEEEIAEDLLRSKEAVALAEKTASGFIKRIKGGEKLTDLFKTKDDSDTDTDTDADTEKDTEEDKKPTAEEEEKNEQQEKTFELAETSSFPRSGRFLVPGIGISKELMGAAFKLKEGEVADKPYVVDQIVYLVAVKEKKEPDWKEWEKNKDDLTESYLTQKWADLIRDHAFRRCEEALKEKRLVINKGAMVTPGYQHPKGDPPLPSYAPCSSLRPESVEPPM